MVSYDDETIYNDGVTRITRPINRWSHTVIPTDPTEAPKTSGPPTNVLTIDYAMIRTEEDRRKARYLRQQKEKAKRPRWRRI
jgi:hypothetical protein